MKAILFTSLLLIFSSTSFSQDSSAFKRIDSIVKVINAAKLQIQRDTSKQDQPQFGVSGITIVTALFDGKVLKRYENHVEMAIKREGKTEETVGSNIFYFDNDQLIKVEEYAFKNGVRKGFDWYFANGKSLNSIAANEGKSEDRGTFLLQLGKSLLDKISGK